MFMYKFTPHRPADDMLIQCIWRESVLPCSPEDVKIELLKSVKRMLVQRLLSERRFQNRKTCLFPAEIRSESVLSIAPPHAKAKAASCIRHCGWADKNKCRDLYRLI